MLLRRPCLWSDRMIWTSECHWLLSCAEDIQRHVMDKQYVSVRARSRCPPGRGWIPLHLRTGAMRKEQTTSEKAAAPWNDLFQRCGPWDVAQQNRVADGACDYPFPRSHRFLVPHRAEDAEREQQAIPVPVCAAGTDLHRRRVPRRVGSRNLSGWQHKLLQCANITSCAHSGSWTELGKQKNVEGMSRCCNGRYSHKRPTISVSVSAARSENVRQMGGQN